ncbi:MAG TPA: alkaline phosphatase family protein [Candidatus Krumholzibacteria bacterium]|nr:alkaline phosphatase family protein [Candidatus Krumholzibacteria bacterium]
MSNRLLRSARVVALAALGAVLIPAPALAYIGPGAGFALVSSFVTVFVAFAAGVLAIFTFPVRATLRQWKRRRSLRRARVKRVVILGLDGLDPDRCEMLMDRGDLPHLAQLRAEGTYRRLGTSMPALSPVAWSTFATGVDPSRHGIYDFIARDPRNYAPMLSSSEVWGHTRMVGVGRLRFPVSRGGVRGMRRSRTFWSVLSSHGVRSAVMRVPITFPVEKIDGVMIAGMCVPDLRGTQGSFTFITSDRDHAPEGGVVVEIGEGGGDIDIPGPPSPLTGKTLHARARIQPRNGNAGEARDFVLRIDGDTVPLREREYTAWIRLTFRAARGVSLHGIARFYPVRLSNGLALYMTPIHVDPESPAMPISHPSVFSIYLSKLMGPFGTLGLAEDTTALNDGAIDEQGFLDQAYGLHEERCKMWRHTLAHLRAGLAVCVFDISDRLQHMFYRYLDATHPANDGRDTTQHADAVNEMYRRMDELVGETKKSVDRHTALFVLSDHGFKNFRRGVNLNGWLLREGLLVLKDGAGPGEYLDSIDWSRTQAYALGLSGIYVNLAGRERHGIVTAEDAPALKRRIIDGLVALRDGDAQPIRRVVDVAADWSGPYRHGGPDLLPGYANGFRVSWECAKGSVPAEIFQDNHKCWSGDHCVDSEIVPGVLFSNVPLRDDAGLIDMGPTVLELFGVDVPAYMTGRSLLVS